MSNYLSRRKRKEKQMKLILDRRASEQRANMAEMECSALRHDIASKNLDDGIPIYWDMPMNDRSQYHRTKIQLIAIRLTIDRRITASENESYLKSLIVRNLSTKIVNDSLFTIKQVDHASAHSSYIGSHKIQYDCGIFVAKIPEKPSPLWPAHKPEVDNEPS